MPFGPVPNFCVPNFCAQEDRAAAEDKAWRVAEKLREMKLREAATMITDGVGETLGYMAFPREHWRSLRTNNPLERLTRLSLLGVRPARFPSKHRG